MAVSAAAGYLAHIWFPLRGGETAVPWQSREPILDPLLGTRRPEFSLPDLDGRLHGPEEWDGQVVLINFWASWCSPCRQEIPGFVRLQRRYGERAFSIVGIAVDRHEDVVRYSEELGINYTVLIGDLDAIAVGEAFGNYTGGLPYSVIVNRNGKIAFTHRGLLHEDEADRIVQRHL